MLENFSATPERFLDVDWEEGARGPAMHVVRLSVTAMNSQGLLSSVANAISKQKAVLTNLRLGRREDEECDLNIDVEVRDTRHLAELMGTLRACEGVIRVDRSRS